MLIHTPEIIADPVTVCGTAEVTSSKVFDLGTLESGPAKPRNISFPTTVMNKQNRSFVRSWLDDYEWLEYSVSEDAAYCYPCRVMNAPKRQHDALVRGGLKNWANAKVTMKRHQGEKTPGHRDAVYNYQQYQLSSICGYPLRGCVRFLFGFLLNPLMIR